MIWYLLYPFRGTTEPPVLTPNHPLRQAFYRYGAAAARHWLAFILFSVAVAVLLCYPVFFLYENPTTGFSKLPYHVWTSARLYDGAPNTQPDIEIRQVWVHGNYTRALNQHVLLEALSIQSTLVANHTVTQFTGLENDTSKSYQPEGQRNSCKVSLEEPAAWGFHSPLMFWNCSVSAVKSDQNISHTINRQASRRSYLNLTLRPTSVFAGKSFAKDEIIAADALVITLFDRVSDITSHRWDKRLDQLARDAPGRWSLYPRDGHVAHSRLYEFQQKPLSFQDNFFLLLSYILMIIYVVISLNKLRAVKSRFGLMIAVGFEIVVSITASFSICGTLKLDLARIPDAAYPFVALVMGLENMFRLINAVLAQPPELPTVHRIATALGEVGHLSLATAAQMLFILWILSKVASGVAAFCLFAAVALVFDFIFHLTFFLAVLSVDVRRMELQDSLDRVNATQPRKQSTSRPERRYWLDALLQGRLPFSSRIAGSAISICFILALNMHFYDSGSIAWSLVQSLKSMLHSHSGPQSVPFIAPPINQARTPAAWLRIQDYRYAQEVLEFVKPSAHNIIARVYDPLIVVLHHSNRSGVPLRDSSLIEIFWQIIRKHVYPFLLTVIFFVAVVTLLMQYMLWNELPEEELEITETAPSELSLDTLPKAHRLDVISLAGCSKGHLVSVSVDRLISVSLFDLHTHRYSLSVLTATALTPPLWPIVAVAIDDQGSWAAFCSQSGNIAFWNLAERRLSHFIRIDLSNQSPAAFSLVIIDTTEGERPTLVVVLPSGVVTEVGLSHSRVPQSFEISQEKLVSATVSRSRMGTTITALARSGRVRIATKVSGDWTFAALERIDPRLAPGSKEGKIKSITTIPSLGAFAAVRLRVVELVDIATKTAIYTFPAVLVAGHSLRVLNSPRRECKICHSLAVHSISLVYTDYESQSCITRTYTLSDDHNDLLCLAPKMIGKTQTCKSLSSAKEISYTIEHPGTWESTHIQSIIGIRARTNTVETPCSTTSTASGVDPTYFTINPSKTLKSRSQNSNHKLSTHLNMERSYSTLSSETDEWEVWSLSSAGDFQTEPLHPPNQGHSNSIGEDDLLVASPGPIVQLGGRSVALGFGNRIKVIMIGNERFNQDFNEYQDLAHIGGVRRRRVGGKRMM